MSSIIRARCQRLKMLSSVRRGYDELESSHVLNAMFGALLSRRMTRNG
ncbi:hypothetical protein [Pantoea stewartii]